MQFQQDWPKDKKITALLFFCLKTWKNFARLSFMVRLQSDRHFFLLAQLHEPYSNGNYRLAELKYAFFRRTGRNTKKYRAQSYFFGRSLTLSRPGGALCAPLTYITPYLQNGLEFGVTAW